MDCRETQALLTAFHDGELTAADRARVEGHLRDCPECRALLADLARADQAAGVPDPGPAYWDRFNARVTDRVKREAEGPGVAVLRPKDGWMRRQLRYLVPAVAAAALVMMVVRYGGMRPGIPAPTAPPSTGGRAAPESAGERMAGGKPGSLETRKAESGPVAHRTSPPVPADGRIAGVTREGRNRPAARPLPAGSGETSRDRAAAPAAIGAPSPPPTTLRGGPAGSPPVPAADGMAPGMGAGEKKAAGAAAPMAESQLSGKTISASGRRTAEEPTAGSPCEEARTLSARNRLREAEDVQRACLAGELDAPSREKGLVFLAELLDRQARFTEADALIAEIRRRFPDSLPLDLYLRRRPAVQKRSMEVPATR